MKCLNCKQDLKRVYQELYYCDNCNELFELKDKKLTPVSDKEKAIKEIVEKAKNYGDTLYDIADKLGITLDEGKDSAFPFGF